MDINIKLKSYLDNMFTGTQETKAVVDLKEELYVNLLDRYSDLVQDGVDTEEAFLKTTNSIGNIDELLDQIHLEEKSFPSPEEKLEVRRRSALIQAVAISLYIFACVVFFAIAVLANKVEIAAVVGVLIAIIPTAMLIYDASLYPKYRAKDDSVVEEFKKWNEDEKRSKSLKAAASSVLWTFITIVYIIVSFKTGAWYITWVIFLIGSALQAVVNLLTANENKPYPLKSAASTVLWTLTTAVYFIVSFKTGTWYITWVTFLIAACLQGVLNLLFVIKEW